MTIERLWGLFPGMTWQRDIEDDQPDYIRRAYRANCPAHRDAQASLDIIVKSRKRDRQIVGIMYRCHAGCTVRQILDYAGICAEELAADGVKTNMEDELPANRSGDAAGAHLAETVERALTVGIETGKGVREVAAVVQKAVEALGAMAETVRVTNERMGAIEEEMRSLREQIRTMEKATPEQAKTINRLIRQRAKDICEEYRIGQTVDLRPGKGRPGGFEWAPDPDKAAKLTAAIRADVREMTGVKTAREIARCDVEPVMDFVLGWDDYETIQKIRKGGRMGRKGSAGADGRTDTEAAGRSWADQDGTHAKTGAAS